MKFAGLTIQNIFLPVVSIWLLSSIVTVNAVEASCAVDSEFEPAQIERVRLPPGEGEGYRMRYCVPVPLEIYWQFKTDFRNDFLIDNPHIKSHQFIRRQGNAVLTENRYTHNSKRLFRWQTTVFAREYRLTFELLNPEEAGQKFHHGSIHLEARGRNTLIYQEARFQFSGAAFWAFYPWRGGMRSFLSSFVEWEQQAAQNWQAGYEESRLLEAREQDRMRRVFSISTRYPER